MAHYHFCRWRAALGEPVHAAAGRTAAALAGQERGATRGASLSASGQRQPRVSLFAAGLLAVLARFPWLDLRLAAGLFWESTLVLLAVTDVFFLGRRLYHVAPPATTSDLLPMPGAADFLARQPGPFRILPAGRELQLQRLRAGRPGVGGRLPSGEAPGLPGSDRSGALTQPSVLQMLNVRYVLSPAPIQWEVPAVFQGDGWVYPWPDSLPRAWAVSAVEAVAGLEQVRARLSERTFDPAQTALVYAGDAPAGGGAGRVARVARRSRRRTSVSSRSRPRARPSS